MKKFLACLVTLVLLLTFSVAALADYNIDTAKSSVVRIQVYFTVTDSRVDPSYTVGQPYVIGSGFAIGDTKDATVTHIITAGHVVMHNPESGNVNQETCYLPTIYGDYQYLSVVVNEIRVLINDRSSFVLAQLAGVSDRADVAVLSLNTAIRDRKSAVLLNKTDFATNASVTAMGFPAASEVNLTDNVNDQLIATTNTVTVNKGTVSRFDPHATTGFGDQIQTTAEMSGGISGGPLVDDDGYVVGVCTSGHASIDNVNYAVSTTEILRLLRSLTGVKWTEGPVKEGLSTTMVILIAAAVLIIILLIVLIAVSSSKKKNARVMIFGGVLNGRQVDLKVGTPVVVGRDPNKCQVVYPKDTPGVSTVHCAIIFDGNAVTVADNGSSYGTYVGGVKVEPGKPLVMHRGQEMYFGSDKNKAELH